MEKKNIVTREEFAKLDFDNMTDEELLKLKLPRDIMINIALGVVADLAGEGIFPSDYTKKK